MQGRGAAWSRAGDSKCQNTVLWSNFRKYRCCRAKSNVHRRRTHEFETDKNALSVETNKTRHPKSPPYFAVSTLEQDGQEAHRRSRLSPAVFACIATLFTAPAAILIGRYFRGRPWWFKAHLWLQSVTASCIIIVFAVGIVAVLSGASHIVQLTGPKADAHHDLGLAILILFLLQYLLGIAAHYTHSAGPAGAQKGAAFPTLSTPKHALRHLHVFCGVAMTALLYAGVKTGMDEWDTVSDMGTRVPSGIVVVYWLFFGIEVAAYLFGWVMEPLRAKKTQRAAASLDGGSEEKVAVEA